MYWNVFIWVSLPGTKNSWDDVWLSGVSVSGPRWTFHCLLGSHLSHTSLKNNSYCPTCPPWHRKDRAHPPYLPQNSYITVIYRNRKYFINYFSTTKFLAMFLNFVIIVQLVYRFKYFEVIQLLVINCVLLFHSVF